MVKRIIDDAQADGLDDYAALNYCDEAGYCETGWSYAKQG